QAVGCIDEVAGRSLSVSGNTAVMTDTTARQTRLEKPPLDIEIRSARCRERHGADDCMKRAIAAEPVGLDPEEHCGPQAVAYQHDRNRYRQSAKKVAPAHERSFAPH